MPVAADEVIMTVMLLSIPSRLEKNLIPLYNRLITQVGDNKEVEILCLVDNKSMSIGEKRQSLLDIARGRWVGFLDDDDDVSDDYIDSLLKAMKESPADVITFDQHCSVNGKEFTVNFKMNNPHEPYIAGAGTTHLRRPPYHMCFWHRKIAKNVRFPSISYGEDIAWCSAMYPFVTSETHLDKVLHRYQYDDRTSESIQYANK
jgi:hypothetical protein